MKTIETTVLVAGGGPGGYVAAIRCGQLGLKTVLVDKDRFGGTCLIRGCIPSKAIIDVATEYDRVLQVAGAPRRGISLSGPPVLDFEAMMTWKDSVVDKLNSGVVGLLRRAKVHTLHGNATFTDAKTCIVDSADGSQRIVAEHVVLATGSTPTALPTLPFGGAVISSNEAFALTELPSRMVVIGAGYIGLELGIAFRKLGVEITLIEQQLRILPQYDEQLSQPVMRTLQKLGVTVHLGAQVTGYNQDDSRLNFMASNGESQSAEADKYLVTVGRTPATAGWGLSEMAVDMNGHFVKVDSRCATSMHNVWAIGDLTGEPMLAHKASAQGEMVAEIIAGRRRRFDPVAIPAVCFTDPEIVTVGAFPQEIDGDNMVVSTFPFQANGRSQTLDEGDNSGFVRIVSNRRDGHIVGIQCVGHSVSELAGEFTLAIEMGALVDDIAGSIHAHPTLGEAFHEAALKAREHTILM